MPSRKRPRFASRSFLKQFSATQAAVLYALATGPRNPDKPIAKLYAKFRTDPQPERRMQQAVGSVVAKINVKLAEHGYRIMPGSERRTYRIYRTASTK